MKILLVQAYLGGHEDPVFPLGLNYLARYLDGHDIAVFDPNVAEDPDRALSEKISAFNPDLVGISLRNIDSTNKRRVVFYYRFFREMVARIRADVKNTCRIAAGGSGFSMLAREIMADEPGIDYGFVREGEKAFAELADHPDTPEKVAGVLYRQAGKVVFSGSGAPVDTESLQSAYHEDADTASYRELPEAVGVETKRGCTLGCIYCVYPFLNGRKYRFRKPADIADEIEYIVGEKGVDRFTFIDSTFNVPLDHAEAVLRAILGKNLNVSWSAWFHDGHITASFADLMVAAGCRKVILSPDGFSDSTLKRLGKSQSNRDIVNTFHLLKQYREIEICYNFFKNPPGQTWKNFLGMLGFIYKAKRRLGSRVHFELNSLRIEPGTKLHQLALREGIVKKEERLLYPRYYTNKNTVYMNMMLNAILKLKGK